MKQQIAINFSSEMTVGNFYYCVCYLDNNIRDKTYRSLNFHVLGAIITEVIALHRGTFWHHRKTGTHQNRSIITAGNNCLICEYQRNISIKNI